MAGNKLEAWLAFLCEDGPERTVSLIAKYLPVDEVKRILSVKENIKR